MDTPTSPQFERTLSLFDAVGVVVCAMIGSGIFIVSAQAAADLQSGSLLLTAWFLAGIMTIIGALTYAELAANCPEVGGQYAYIKNAWGQLPAFLYGWSLSFVIKSGSIAAVAIGFAKFLSVLFPSLGVWTIQLGFLNITSHKLMAIFLILALTFINALGVKVVARIQSIVTVTNLLALGLIIVTGTIFSFHSPLFSQNVSLAPLLQGWNLEKILVLGMALVGPLFALDGWNNVTFIAAELKNPARNLPLALIFGVGLTTLLYMLVNGVYLAVLSLSDIIHAENGVVGTAMMRSALGPSGGQLIAVIIMVAAFGCVNSMILSGSRALYALAEDGHLLKLIAQLGRHSHVPENALWLQAAWSVLLVLTRAFSDLLDYMVFAALLFYGLTVAGLFISRRKQPTEAHATYRMWGYPWLPIIYCLFCVWIMGSLLWLKSDSALISLGIVLLGLPWYWIVAKKRNLSNRQWDPSV